MLREFLPNPAMPLPAKSAPFPISGNRFAMPSMAAVAGVKIEVNLPPREEIAELTPGILEASPPTAPAPFLRPSKAPNVTDLNFPAALLPSSKATGNLDRPTLATFKSGKIARTAPRLAAILSSPAKLFSFRPFMMDKSLSAPLPICLNALIRPWPTLVFASAA